MATANLLDASQSFMTPDNLNKLSAALGQSSDKVQSGLKSVIPAFIMGLAKKGSTTEGAESLVNLVKQEGFDSEISSPNITDENYLKKGDEAVSGVLGNNLNIVINGLTTSTGMNSTSIKKMLSMIAPIILGILGSKIKKEGLGATGVMGFLNQQKSVVTNFLSTGGTSKYSVDEQVPARKTPSSTRSDYRKSDFGYVGEKQSGKLWGILGLLAVIALSVIMWMYSKNRAINIPDVSVPTSVQKSTVDMETGVQPGMIAPAASLDELADFVEFGSTFDLPRRFRFDYFTFNTEAKNLSPEASKELDLIAIALKSKSTVKGRLEGFTDNAGDQEANVQLSTEKVTALKNLLVSRGIAADRIEVIGRGEATPIAENNSEAGKALNRRIEFVVTQL